MKRIVAFALTVAMLLCGFAALAEPAPEASVRPGVDYADADNWAYFGIGEDKAADLFLICPTVDMNDEFSMSLEDADTKARFLSVLNMERGIYEASARLYAPYYRQAAMKVYSLDPAEREPWLALAYEDISAAFAWYLAHENEGRPIILAGFSQGADMCYRLLEEYFGDEALYNQLVAVYAIGWPYTEEMTAQYPQIVPATGEDDLGVVVSFDCEAPEVTETFITPAGVRALTINPLNWRTDGTPADKSENLGACFMKYSEEIKREEAGLCGCYIDESRGALKVTDVDPADYPPVVPGLPEGAYHVYDYMFFFRNLQKNVAVRTARFLETRALDDAAEAPFAQWNPDAPALNALIEYVEAVTDPDSKDFIPEADRIATFDMDGTLMGELAPTYLEVMLLTERILADPTWQPDAEMLEFGRMTRDHALDKSFPDDYDYQFSCHQAKAFAGMTLAEFADFVTRFLVREADGFTGMTYADMYYQPMAEVVEYLRDNGFKCYVVSGSDRFIVRTFIEGVMDIPSENCIGSDTALEARDQGDADGIEYVFTGDDALVRTDRLLVKDLKTNKVLQIAQEIGRQPVLSFGNSGGDVAMHNYALYNNKYRSAAFQLIADDGERDYGSPEKGAELREKWEGMGFTVISMRDDWKTIYGEDVKKTGKFRWLEAYADDRIPAVPEAEAEAEADPDVQYVLHLGTNDKDTNKPVFTQAEALERAKDILIRHFGGYTIQEAHGGWIDNETEYQEYTLVIYLSDTTMDKVHAVADEMIEVFRQSTVLIQENPTRTEFYSPVNP